MNHSQDRSRLLRLIRSPGWLAIPPILIGMGVIIALASSKKELERVDAKETASPVRVVEAAHQQIAPTSTGYGTVSPKRTWIAISEVGGRVIEIHQPLRSGIFVTKGSLLVKIDPADYELLEKQRDADLQQATAELRQLELNEQADRKSLKIQQELQAVRKADVDRLKKLSGSAAASVSELDLAISSYLTQAQAIQNLESNLQLYDSRKSAAEAQIQAAQAKLAEAERDLERTEIRSPIDGVLSEVQLEVGQYVSPNQVLFRILEVSKVEVEAQFSLAQLLRLLHHEGASPQILGTAGTRNQLSAIFSARVNVHSGESMLQYDAVPIRVADQVDSETRTLGVVVEVENPSFSVAGQTQGSASIALRPGTFCEVVLESKDKINGVLLQRSAIDRDAVYVVDPQNRLRRRLVQARKIDGAHAVIHGGLHDGDLVIINPPAVPLEGLLVAPILSDAASEDEASVVRTGRRTDGPAEGAER